MEIKVQANGHAAKDENVERGNWSGKFEYLLSLTGYAVGIGSAWRFPYLAYRNGGGAFLVAYLVFLFLFGMPLFFLETALGQFTSLGALSVYKISPLLKGTGYATIIILTYLAVYYNVILSYIIYYFGLSMRSVLLWDSCNNPWNTPECTTAYKLYGRSQRNQQFTNYTIYPNSTEMYDENEIEHLNINGMSEANVNVSFHLLKSPAHEFFYKYVLDMSDGIHDLGNINWVLALCLLASWVLVLLCLCKGVKTVGKVVYFTATFPYFVLVVLLCRGIILPGALDGVIFYIYPDWPKLLTKTVWSDAALQVFYSLGPGWGGLITMASFNKFHKDCYSPAVIVPIINVFTAILAGFVVFSILGYLSHQTGIPISEVVTGGPGLAFIVYPEAVSLLPTAPLWSVMFFFMMLTLGLDTQFVTIETIVSAIWDELPTFAKKRRIYLSVGICTVMFLAGLICVTRLSFEFSGKIVYCVVLFLLKGGFYLVQLLDWYCAHITILLICIMECVAIGWIYGVDNFARDIEFMLNRPVNRFWKFSWKYFSPIILTCVLLITIVDNSTLTIGDYQYPEWAIGLGWTITASSMFMIPFYAIYKICITSGSIKERFLLFLPHAEYGPALPMYYQKWKEYCLTRPHYVSSDCDDSDNEHIQLDMILNVPDKDSVQ